MATMIEQMRDLLERVQRLESRHECLAANVTAAMPAPIPVVEPLSGTQIGPGTVLAPSPDYRSELPRDAVCGCEEAVALRAEVASLRRRLEAVKALFKATDDDRRREWQRAEKAESECAALRAEVLRLTQEKAAESAAKDAVNAAVRAEVERLRAENTECRRLLLRRVEATRLDEANAQLAAANAEVERLRAEAEGAFIEAGVQRSMADAANALLERIQQWERAQCKREVAETPWVCLMNALDAHLSSAPATAPAQPAAPVPAVYRCSKCGHTPRSSRECEEWQCDQCGGCMTDQPAAQSESECSSPGGPNDCYDIDCPKCSPDVEHVEQASQPAAPTRSVVKECEDEDCDGNCDQRRCDRKPYGRDGESVQPAAPSETVPPYAVLADGCRVPLMNCPDCKELGRADMAHYHVCPDVKTAAEQRVLEAARRFLESWEDHEAYPDKDDMPEEYELCRAAADLRAIWVDAELARREGKP